ncbi:MAG: nuclear transport factor 2 family protein [Sphingomonas sp.]|nr:nuclear transport factor 2 family protein [Sphingomonas sp.]
MTVKALIAVALFALPITAQAQPKAGAIEARLERVEADLAIRRVLVDYAAFLDGRDYTRYAGLFTADGEWRNGTGSHKGRPAIRAMLATVLGPEGTENKANYHLVSNPQIDVTGTTATATSRYLFVMRGPGGQPRPSLAGVYRDDLVRIDGRWMIRRRVASDIMPTPEEWATFIAAQQSKP